MDPPLPLQRPREGVIEEVHEHRFACTYGAVEVESARGVGRVYEGGCWGVSGEESGYLRRGG